MNGRGARIAALIAIGVVVVGLAIYVGTLGVLTGAIQPGPRASGALPTTAPSSPLSPPSPGPTVAGTIEPGTIAFPTSLQLSVPSRDVLWMFAGSRALFRSIDRGETWFQRPLPPSLPNFEQSFVNEREGFVSSVGSPGTQCLFQSVQIWRTADGGSGYERLPASGIADAQCKAGLIFIDPQRGFLPAWSPNDKPVVYRTSDGGRTWQASQPFPDPPGFTTQPAASTLRVGPGPIRSFGNMLLLQAFGNVLSGERDFVFRSLDGGATWTLAATVPNPSPIGFVTATRWIQLILPGQSLETTDAGTSWHAYAADWGQAGPTPPTVIFADPEVGYTTTSRGGFQRTTDGGLHWTGLRPPGGP
jgi:photosystem II stability/assembly factor-like uncharacterized protein